MEHVEGEKGSGKDQAEVKPAIRLPSDNPLKIGEDGFLVEDQPGPFKKKAANYPVTPKAHIWLRVQALAEHGWLRLQLAIEAKAKGFQLTLAETQAVADRPCKADQPGVNIELYPTTPLAANWLREQWLNRNDQLKKWLVTEAKASGSTLNLEKVQEVKKRFFTLAAKLEEEKKNLLELRPDENAPAEVNCLVCEAAFKTYQRYKLQGGVRVEVDGQQILLGNYKLIRATASGEPDPNGEQLIAVAICKDCEPTISGDCFTFAGAQAEIERIQADEQAEKDKGARAAKLRQSLVGRDGTPRFNSGRASRDIDEASRALASRREKNRFQRGR